jgi:hypothetical protein
MSDFHEQDTGDQDEVEIVDLGAPDKGLSRYFFTLGEKWHAAASLRVKLVVLVVALSLLIAVLQPGSSFVNNQTPDARLLIPTYALPYKIDCTTAISITTSQEITWHLFSSTSSNQGVVIVCSSGKPLLLPSSNDGKNP